MPHLRYHTSLPFFPSVVPRALAWPGVPWTGSSSQTSPSPAQVTSKPGTKNRHRPLIRPCGARNAASMAKLGGGNLLVRPIILFAAMQNSGARLRVYHQSVTPQGTLAKKPQKPPPRALVSPVYCLPCLEVNLKAVCPFVLDSRGTFIRDNRRHLCERESRIWYQRIDPRRPSYVMCVRKKKGGWDGRERAACRASGRLQQNRTN